MRTEYKYIHFEIMRALPKTKVWACVSNRGDATLGEVKWWAAWRQYCFLPRPAGVFNRGCLEDINDFINQAMKEHKKGG